jgi:peroxiredoxin-like protein
MSDTQYSSEKKTKKFLFEVQLNWLTAKKGIMTANDVKGSLYVATPHAFGGEGMDWSPEHLFLGAVSSCYMSTYLVFSAKAGITVAHLSCDVIGQIEMVDGKYKFTHVDVFPKIYVTEEAAKEKAAQSMLVTQQHCLVSNSIDAEVVYHGEVFLETHPRGLFQ